MSKIPKTKGKKIMTENNFQIDSAAVSDRGLSKKRPQNEDSFWN
ncbi:MAG: hypothetical protein WKF71_12160 [Pyrinomonadaceae bacterium]